MEGSAEFLQQLTEALEKRGRWLQGTQIPGLKAALQSYQSLFESIMGMLIRKGLLREDPYNYEQSIKDITVPSDEPLPEFENTDETSYRLAEFRRQLKFVVTEADFSLSSLSLARLKKISALYSYVNWSELADNSTSPITRSFGRAFMKILLGADAMAAQILKDQETQIVKVFHDVRSLVADLVGFHRESWKAEVRRTILPRLMLAPGQGKKEETFRAIRTAFQKEGGGRPWYPALAQEIIAEELESDAAHRKEKLLASLAIPAPDAGEDKKEADARPLLMEAVRILSRPHEELVTAVESLSESERLLKGREGGIRPDHQAPLPAKRAGEGGLPYLRDTIRGAGTGDDADGEGGFPELRGRGAEKGHPPGVHCGRFRSRVQTAGGDEGDDPCGLCGQADQRASPHPSQARELQYLFSGKGQPVGEAGSSGDQARAADAPQQPREGKPEAPRIR